MNLGCSKDHAQFFDGSTLNITSHQESMISKITLKIFLEIIVLKRIKIGN